MEIDLSSDKRECCGCFACFNVCPKHAITMKADKKGFYYPEIDSDKCIECGLCMKVCDFKKTQTRDNNILETYALRHKQSDAVKHSSSGGAFTAISDYVLAQNGIVVGAALDNSNFEVRHIATSTKEDRNRLRGAKYVQSQMGDIYKVIKDSLKKGILVLFSGTPCQCAALLSYLRVRPENLILVDILCHGTPSNKLLQDHVKLWEEKTGKSAVDYEYRSKKYGYEQTNRIVFSDGTEDTSIDLKRIFKLFSYTMRPSCYNCKYTSRHRFSDFTIGDLWNAGDVVNIYDHMGTSVVFVNSQKGLSLMSKIEDSCRLIKFSQTKITQQALSHPVTYESTSDKIWSDYFSHGYKFILDKYAPYTLLSWGYNMLWRSLHITRLANLGLFVLSKLHR